MKGKALHYYAAGNTAKGFYSLYDSVLDGLQRLFILKGGPGTGKSTLMKKIGEQMRERGLDVEYLHCASDNNSIDGVILTNEKIGIVDGTAPHVIEPKAPGVIDDYVHLGVAWDRQSLLKHKDEILQLNSEIAKAFQDAYDTFAEALTTHQSLEHLYINHMDFAEADKLTAEVVSSIFTDDDKKVKGTMKHRFLGAATPKGAVDFMPNLTEGIEKRYLIKGRAGSGKSTMLKKIAHEGMKKGFDIEVYHCGFDPQSVDMVIIREKSVAIFDSTGPHEYFPEKETDELIDIYERCIEKGTDERFAEEIAEKTAEYKRKVKIATSYLAEAKELRDQLESYYIEAMDFSKVEDIEQSLLTEMEELIEH